MKPYSLIPIFTLCTSLAMTPAMSEETVPEDKEDGMSLMEEGAMLFFKGLQQQMEPTLKDLTTLMEEAGPALKSFVAEMGPALTSLLKEVEDWSAYHPPEILDNGDIIIRKKTPEEREEKAPEADQDETDL